jgi:Ca2+-binding EF-hand superfamily protein
LIQNLKTEHEDQLFEKQARAAFELFDEDGGGTIDKEEFGRCYSKICGRQLTDEELDTMMERLDEDGSGCIDFEEFHAGMKQILTTSKKNK